MNIRHFALLLAICLTFAIVAPSGPASIQAQGDATPVFEPADCLFTLPAEATTVNCGYVTVPLDRTVADSPTIRLAVAVFPAQTSTPAPDPVIYLDGGPGGHTLEVAEFTYESIVAPHLAYRDVILFDQRGVSFSEPNLECTGLREFELSLYEDTRDEAAILADYEAITTACRDEISARVDLNAINSTQNAADVADIITALGYGEYNIYGISYGTMLAQYVVRDHPANVRSVIIDSNVPLTVDLYEEIPANFERALSTLIAACSANADCAANYGDLENVLTTLVADLNANPITVAVNDPFEGTTINVHLTGDALLDSVFSALYSEQLFPLLPRAIYSLAAGDNTLISQLLLIDIINAPYGNSNMYAAVMCNDEVGFNSPDEYVGVIATTRPILQNLYSSELQSFFWVCELFDDGVAAPAIDNQLVTSDIPTLVISGEFDPITPPAWGDVVAEGFSNSFVYVFPNAGHGATTSSACATQVMVDFVNNPSVAPDTTCVSDLTLAFDVPFSGTVELTSRQFTDALGGTQLVADMPTDWVDVGGGTFSPPTNPNLGVSVLVAPFGSIESTVDVLSGNISFDNELDPITLGDRTWVVYETELDGIPTLIALTDNGGGNIFVALLLAPAEDIQAMRTAVFEPLLASLQIVQ